MPRRSKVETLPKALKAWLDRELVGRNFSDYRGLADELNRALEPHGMTVSLGGLHSYGHAFEERLRTLRLVTEQARAFVEGAPDDDGAVNDALVRLTQEKLFGVLLDMQVDPAKINLTTLARAVADLGKASVEQKRLQIEVRKKALEDAASAANDEAQHLGLSAEAAEQIRRRILGQVQ